MNHQPAQIDISNLLDFLNQAVTPWHASNLLAKMLDKAGFMVIESNTQWPELVVNERYYYLKDGSICAFIYRPDEMLRLAFAHTDSPNLRIKLDSDKFQHGLHTVGVSVYGGALLNPWYDRPLGIAGQVSWMSKGQLSTKLIRLPDASAFIPSLAIHLDRTANTNRSINPQTDILAIYSASTQQPDSKAKGSSHNKLLAHILQYCYDNHIIPTDIEGNGINAQLCLFDNQPAHLVGLEQEFLLSGRLDNLLSCYILVDSIIHNQSTNLTAIACLDHEEIGSRSATGGDSAFLLQILQLITKERKFSHNSNDLAISADNAHAIHPAFTKYHEPDYAPLMGAGPVLKTEVNHRYATTLQSETRLRYIAQQAEVNLQHFTSRGDTTCGSTLGPILAAKLSLSVVDIGIPQFAMHSAVESAHIGDIKQTASLMQTFFSDTSKVL